VSASPERALAALKRARVWLGAAFLVLILLPVGFLLVLRLGGFTPLINLIIARQLKPLTGVQLRLGSVRSDGFHFIEADDVVVLAPLEGAKLPLLTASSLRLEYDAWAALRGRLPADEALQLMRVRGLNVYMLRDAQGQWNVGALEGRRPAAGPKARGGDLPWLPAGRVELEDSQVVFNDEVKGFHSTMDNLQGSVDTRALPLIAFSLAGRTEGAPRDNVSLAGEADLRDRKLDGRLDLAEVELKEYLNYFLPGQTLRFEDGKASLSVRLHTQKGQELHAEGRADLQDGRLRIPGVEEPLSGLTGSVSFNPTQLRFRSLQARFLDSDWSAEGGLDDLRHPHYNVLLKNPAFGLAAISQQVKGMEPLRLSGTASLEVRMTGPAAKPRMEGLVQAPWLSLAGVDLNGVRAGVLLQGPSLQVDGLRATVWDGDIQGSFAMGLEKGGRLRAEMVLDGAKIESMRVNGQRPLPLSGTAFIELKLRGRAAAPSLEGRLEIPKAFLGSQPLNAFEATARWSPEAWRADFSTDQGRIAGGVGALGGPKAAFENTAVELQGLDLNRLAYGLATAPPSSLLPASVSRGAAWAQEHFKGKADATLRIDGPLKDPLLWLELKRLQGTFVQKDGFLKLADFKKPFDVTAEGLLGFDKRNLHLGLAPAPFKLALAHKSRTLELQGLGRYPLRADGKPGALEIAAEGDLRLLDGLDAFKKSSGKLSFDGRLGGTLDAPQAQGELKVDGFNAEPQAYLAPVKDGTLRAQFREQSIEVTQLKFKAGGTLEASGRLDLSQGLKNLNGEVSARTDAEGLRFQNWDGMGSGNVILDPLNVQLDGNTQPLTLKGRIKLTNAVINYGGKKSGDAPAAGAAPRAAGPGLSLDLRIGLGPNVWYEKLHDKSVDIDLADPNVAHWLQSVADSAIETFQRPDMYFRLRPTDRDFVIRGSSPDINLVGDLVIDQGRMTIMENEFKITRDVSGAMEPHVHFTGRRGDVVATAVARLRYTRDDPLTKRPRQISVNAIADITPLPDAELEKSDLRDAFLNYRLNFRSEPPIVAGGNNEAAVLNLVVLGDPLVDLDQAGGTGATPGTGAKVGATQIDRLISGELRKQISKLSKKGFKFLGRSIIDVFRVVPRFKYQSASPAPAAKATSAAEANEQAQELTFSDITLELGKSLGDKLYASVQWVRFGEQSIDAQNHAAGQVQRITRDSGGRAGLEYQLSPTRTLEGYYNYSVDENLEPVPFSPDKLWEAHSGVIRLRSTIPTDNYSPELARHRRWGAPAKQEDP
jgi:hypothetical protein